ncbi:hypothetical protein IY145_01370 [Methylosinus sp. H3A]|uniref:hypothetical protein n=1 Tax=Methylosinus sp. H3A TaxID=2785786 RepID=UPI0018C26B5F|nr:hypothetical protein [Methylosinus sp. H3A]MBG0808066.1 hypothetical protein [Methylosinus sp. H3A]
MLPTAIIRSLRTPQLTAPDFTPTKFHTTDDKAWFANALLKFLADDCPQSAFTDRLYVRLSNSFGNIAHHDRTRFYDNFFVTSERKIGFLEQTLRWPCYGAAEFTFCDVEILVQSRIAATNLLAIEQSRRDAEIARRERELLARLKAKYESIPRADPTPSPITTSTLAPSAVPTPRQGSLFDLSQ